MKVLNFGSLNIDYVYSVDHFVRGGETLSSGRMDLYSGGKGLNQSIALSKSGVAVWHAGAVGDGDGDFLLRELQEAGVHTELIRHLDGRSGHAIIQKDRDGQNCILLYGGANLRITKSQIEEALSGFQRGDILILQNEINEIAYLMERAHEKKMQIVFNPSPIDQAVASYPLNYVDFFLLNEIEAADILGTTLPKEEMLLGLAKRFPTAKIVLTLGAEGSIYREGERILRQEIYRVPVVDTTAAGDTFTGFFIGSLALGSPAKEALDLAAKASAIAVSRAGAAPSIPDMAEVRSGKL